MRIESARVCRDVRRCDAIGNAEECSLYSILRTVAATLQRDLKVLLSSLMYYSWFRVHFNGDTADCVGVESHEGKWATKNIALVFAREAE